MNKKGEELVIEQVIFIVLNIVFVGLLLAFAYKTSSSAFTFEQRYAKEIALLIDSTADNSALKLDVTEAYEIAKKNNIPKEEMIVISDKEVILKLSGEKGYAYPYFHKVSIDKIGGISYEDKKEDSGNERVFVNIILGDAGGENENGQD